MARRPWQDIGAFAVKVSDVSVRIAGASESVGLYARASLALEDGSSSPYWAAAAPSIETFERAAGQELFEVQLGFVQISAYFELTTATISELSARFTAELFAQGRRAAPGRRRRRRRRARHAARRATVPLAGRARARRGRRPRARARAAAVARARRAGDPAPAARRGGRGRRARRSSPRPRATRRAPPSPPSSPPSPRV